MLTRLGRWCGPWSPMYRDVCKPMVKGFWADCDNSVWKAAPPKPPDNDKVEYDVDPISRLIYCYHG